MNPKFISIIRCPEDDCHGDIEIKERIDVYNGQIENGTLECQACGREYRIRDGFPILLPETLDDEASLSEIS